MPTQLVAFRLPVDLLKKLDAHVDVMRREQPGRTATRADAVRVLLNAALGDEKDDGAGRPRGAARSD
jgi:hypothetical protein